ncbi:hypothetical protein G7Z17_g10988 [Cylindrodendrum hubeiense]|uniref:Mitochondrial import inner membrane translocase subunit TIM50 n=1 Tax=Cylindrodendrum hubeiense TaxID=595255 RepID=A0A9P5H1M9_9HYPO|nr:hypothetical protein G7Z17_g10988 [Cylindrodendrum hubeiense]
MRLGKTELGRRVTEEPRRILVTLSPVPGPQVEPQGGESRSSYGGRGGGSLDPMVGGGSEAPDLSRLTAAAMTPMGTRVRPRQQVFIFIVIVVITVQFGAVVIVASSKLQIPALTVAAALALALEGVGYGSGAAAGQNQPLLQQLHRRVDAHILPDHSEPHSEPLSEPLDPFHAVAAPLSLTSPFSNSFALAVTTTQVISAASCPTATLTIENERISTPPSEAADSLCRPPPSQPALMVAASKPASKPAKRDPFTNTQAPSASSGGVPDPTPQYIAQALLNPQILQQPRRILIVMDLNGTLLYRPNKRRPFHFVERPYARAFLSYCLDTFYVAIWSSARPENVSKMVAQLLTPEQCERCLLVWARDQFGLSPADYDTKVQVYKRLTSVWSNPRVMSSHPAAQEGGRWDQTNTVLVDDSREKARSEPFNLLQIPEFSGLATESPNVLPQVHDYLNSLSHQTDISRFMRQTSFKLDPSYILPSQ